MSNEWVSNDDPWSLEGQWDEPVLPRAPVPAPFDPSREAPDTPHAQDQPARGGNGPAGDRRPKQEKPEQEKPRRAKQEKRRPQRRDPRRVVDIEEDFPPPRRIRAFVAFLAFLAVVAGAALYGVTWYQHQLDPPGAPKQAIELVIPPNTSTASIAKILHKNGIIGNSSVFRYWLQMKGKGGFEAGKYQFRQNSSFESALGVLQDGPTVPDQQRLTIPEGFRISQIAQRIEAKLPGRSAQKFNDAIVSGTIRSAYQPSGSSNLEGFLFPETYTFGLDDDEGVIAARMVETFDQVADQVGLSNASTLVGVSSYEALVVASLVEREAGVDEDRPKIARVIYNRLKADMYLQIDAGIVYAMNNGTTRLTNADYKFDTPYNTYIHKGLPPGPIASPGKASLDAALHPEPGDWLYYVLTSSDGKSSFANTYKEHRQNIKLAEKNGVR